MYTYLFCPTCGKSLEKRPQDPHHRDYCPHCGFVHYINPLPAVIAIVENEKQFLLVQRGKPPAHGEWTFPSGFMEADESPEEACLRELQEETGVTGKIRGLIGVYHEKSALYGDVINLAYAVHPLPESSLNAGDDATDVRYVPLENLGHLAFDSFRRAFQDYQQQYSASEEKQR